MCLFVAPGSPAYVALVEFSLIMGNSEKRKRQCTVCGKPAKGHEGRIGPGRCLAAKTPSQGDSAAPQADTVQAPASGASGGARPKICDPPPPPPPTPHDVQWSDPEDDFVNIPLSRGWGSAARGSGFYSPVQQQVGLYGGKMAVAVGSSQDFASFRRVQDLLDPPGGLQPLRSQGPISPAPPHRAGLLSAASVVQPPPSPILRPPPQPAVRPMQTLMDVNLDRIYQSPPVQASPRPAAASYADSRPQLYVDSRPQQYVDSRPQQYDACRPQQYVDSRPPQSSRVPDGPAGPFTGHASRIVDQGVHYGGDRSCGYGLPLHTDYVRDYGASSQVAPLPYLGEPGVRTSRFPAGTEHVKDNVRASALAGDYVDLSDLIVVTINVEVDQIKTVIDDNGCLSLKPTKPKKHILSSFKWLDAWAVYEILLAHAHGVEIFTEMALYRIFITSLFATYKLPHVLSYDMRHRQILGASRSLGFRSVNHPIYVVTFDVTAVKNSSRCGRCSSTEHGTSSCPFRAPGQAAELPKNPKKQQPDRSGDKHKSDRTPTAEQHCFQFQGGICRSGPKCPRKHACWGCGGPEGINNCAKCKAKLGTS